MSNEQEIEHTVDSAIGRLLSLFREINFHASAAEGAQQGLIDVLQFYEDPNLVSDDDTAIWARRVYSTFEAVSELAHEVSAVASMLVELTSRTGEETKN